MANDLIIPPETLPAVVQKRMQSRKRSSLYRRRRKDGIAIVPVATKQWETEDLLITLGFLRLEAADDFGEFCVAFANFVDAAIILMASTAVTRDDPERRDVSD
jgi:hypothetical protein